MRAYEPRGAGREMDDIAAGVVNDAHLVEKAAAPDRIGADAVGEGNPERDEDYPGGEVHTAQERAGHDDDGDGGEDELKVDHGRQGEVLEQDGRHRWQLGLAKLLLHRHDGTRPSCERQHVYPEGDLVGPEDPDDERCGKPVEGHEGTVDGPFAAHDPRVPMQRGMLAP